MSKLGVLQYLQTYKQADVEKEQHYDGNEMLENEQSQKIIKNIKSQSHDQFVPFLRERNNVGQLITDSNRRNSTHRTYRRAHSQLQSNIFFSNKRYSSTRNKRSQNKKYRSQNDISYINEFYDEEQLNKNLGMDQLFCDDQSFKNIGILENKRISSVTQRPRDRSCHLSQPDYKHNQSIRRLLNQETLDGEIETIGQNHSFWQQSHDQLQKNIKSRQCNTKLPKLKLLKNISQHQGIYQQLNYEVNYNQITPHKPAYKVSPQRQEPSKKIDQNDKTNDKGKKQEKQMILDKENKYKVHQCPIDLVKPEKMSFINQQERKYDEKMAKNEFQRMINDINRKVQSEQHQDFLQQQNHQNSQKLVYSNNSLSLKVMNMRATFLKQQMDQVKKQGYKISRNIRKSVRYTEDSI